MAEAQKKAAFDKVVADPVYMNEQGYMLTNPAVDSSTRCKRRWVDYQRVSMDAAQAGLTNTAKVGKAHTPPFASGVDLLKVMRERYLLYVQCVEAKPGAEPQNPYLYPR